MLWLRSNHSFTTLLELDPVSGNNREVSSSDLADKGPERINGFFDFLDGTLVALYALYGNLILRVGTEVIPLVDGVNVALESGISNHTLIVKHGERELASLTYSPTDDQKIKNDPTPFIEDEDFDFGLFVKNIASNHDRRRVVLENWS